MKKKKASKISTFDIYKSIRKDWNGVNPVQRAIPNKKKYNRKEKYKQKYSDEY